MSRGLHRHRGGRTGWYAAVATTLAVVAVAATVHMRLSGNEPAPHTEPTAATPHTHQPAETDPDAASPPTTPTLPVDELVWDSMCGVPLPRSERYGPHRRDGERGLGFAREPAGVVLAALHLAVQVSPQTGPMCSSRRWPNG